MKTLVGLTITILLLDVAAAAERIDETRAINADGSVEISNVRGWIHVDGSARGDVAISGTLGDGVRGLEVEGNTRRLRIKVQYPENSGGWFGGGAGSGKAGDSQLTVAVPAGVSLVVGGVSADIKVSGIAGRRVEINTVSGEVSYVGDADVLNVESVSGDLDVAGKATEASLQTVSGDIELRAAVSQRLHAETVSGDVDVIGRSPLQALVASAVSGDLTISVTPAIGARIKADTLSGDVDLRLAQGTSSRLRVETFSGSIRSDVGTVVEEEFGPGAHLDGQLGSGDGDIRIETFSGSIDVKSR